jgi:hypothetical protein
MSRTFAVACALACLAAIPATASDDANVECGGFVNDAGAGDGGIDAPVDAKTDAPADAPADTKADTKTDAGRKPCGTITCALDEVCTRYSFSGGISRLPGEDEPSPMNDPTSYTYDCRDWPAACGKPLTCDPPCGKALCPASGCRCANVQASVVTCHCEVP